MTSSYLSTLLASTILLPAAAVAQTGTAAPAGGGAPAGQVVSPQAGTPAQQDPQAAAEQQQEQVDVSTPGGAANTDENPVPQAQTAVLAAPAQRQPDSIPSAGPGTTVPVPGPARMFQAPLKREREPYVRCTALSARG